jgi:hypothetical protein
MNFYFDIFKIFEENNEFTEFNIFLKNDRILRVSFSGKPQKTISVFTIFKPEKMVFSCDLTDVPQFNADYENSSFSLKYYGILETSEFQVEFRKFSEFELAVILRPAEKTFGPRPNFC